MTSIIEPNTAPSRLWPVLEKLDEIGLGPATQTQISVAAEIGRRPIVQHRAGENSDEPLSIERRLIPGEAARRYDRRRNARDFARCSTAIPVGVVLAFLLVDAIVGEQDVPDRDRPAHVERPGNLARPVGLMRRRHFFHEELVERGDVRVGELGIGRIRHRRIEVMPVLGDVLRARSAREKSASE